MRRDLQLRPASGSKVAQTGARAKTSATARIRIHTACRTPILRLTKAGSSSRSAAISYGNFAASRWSNSRAVVSLRETPLGKREKLSALPPRASRRQEGMDRRSPRAHLRSEDTNQGLAATQAGVDGRRRVSRGLCNASGEALLPKEIGRAH